jgi:hypothetical protein
LANQDSLDAGALAVGHDEIGVAARRLREDGFVVLPAATSSEVIGATDRSWARLFRHWDEPALDGYMNDGGTYRYRRYGRYVTSDSETGKPAPQGRHRDGIDYVTSLVIDRHNITGGESSVYTDDGKRRAVVTLSPGDQLLLSDRRMLHDVTPVRPADPLRSAHRDVLLVDFSRSDELGPADEP